MRRKRPTAIEAYKQKDNRVLLLDHVELIEEDIVWLSKTERLTLRNVKAPAGLLARIETLWWLDIRGGSATDLSIAKGAESLQYLGVNGVRGMTDLSLVGDMLSLRYLRLHGGPNVAQLPSCSRLVNLEHAFVGQLRGIVSLRGLLEAPNLRELVLFGKVNVSEDDVSGIVDHPALEAFNWFAEDVPNKVWVPVLKKIELPKARPVHPEEWFHLPEFTVST